MELIPAKTIISNYKAENPWFGNNYNMNIYKGCTHGCIYCDSRSACYGIQEFDRVRAKENALHIIEKELQSKRRTGVIGTGGMSDPYNPFEKEYHLTRGALGLIDKYGFGLSVITKNALVLRDIDLLLRIQSHSPVLVKITITAFDDLLCKKIEPGATLSSGRFAVIDRLTNSGIFTGILLMPILPFIEDTVENISGIIKKAHESGAKFIYPAFGVTLRQGQREYFYEKLDLYFPGVKEKYITTYKNAYSCTSQNVKELWRIFQKGCEQYGILYRMEEIINAYKHLSADFQLSMF